MQAMHLMPSNDEYAVKYGIDSQLDNMSNDNSYLVKIDGVIIHTSTKGGPEVVCGHLRAYRINANEMIADQRFDVGAWHEDEELDDIAQSIFTYHGAWSDELTSAWPDVNSKDLLVIENIFLEDAHRGAELGLIIADRTIALFGRGCGLAVICPWPTELQNRNDEEATQYAHRAIGTYSQRLGFKQIEGTDLWAKTLEHIIERESN